MGHHLVVKSTYLYAAEGERVKMNTIITGRNSALFSLLGQRVPAAEVASDGKKGMGDRLLGIPRVALGRTTEYRAPRKKRVL